MNLTKTNPTSKTSSFDPDKFVELYVLNGGTREEAKEFIEVINAKSETEPQACDDNEVVEAYRKLDRDDQVKLERVAKTLLLLQQTV